MKKSSTGIRCGPKNPSDLDIYGHPTKDATRKTIEKITDLVLADYRLKVCMPWLNDFAFK